MKRDHANMDTGDVMMSKSRSRDDAMVFHKFARMSRSTEWLLWGPSVIRLNERQGCSGWHQLTEILENNSTPLDAVVDPGEEI